MELEYTIKKYTAESLSSYLNSDEYRNSDIWPISYHRALSHIHNPRMDKDDIILTMAESGGKIIGYRTVMADYVFNGDKKIKVGWISGTWVDPEYRRMGLATVLFEEIYKDWNGRLMYTNYAPESKKVYDKTGAFELYAVHTGCRFHMKSNMSEILPSRFPVAKLFSKVLPAADRFFNHFILPFITEIGMKTRLSYNMMIKRTLNEEECVLLFKNNLTKRTFRELNWILKYPWILEVKNMEEEYMQKYFFSSVADVFKQYFMLIYRSGKLISIVMITIRNTQMKLPYFYSADGDLAVIADLLFTEAWKNNISHIDVYDEKLVAEMKLKTAYFAFSKNRERIYFVSRSQIGDFPVADAVIVADGEGDVVFV